MQHTYNFHENWLDTQMDMFPKGILSAISALVIKLQNQSSWQRSCKNLQEDILFFKAFLIWLLQLLFYFHYYCLHHYCLICCRHDLWKFTRRICYI
jgi:hypothetical protein